MQNSSGKHSFVAGGKDNLALGTASYAEGCKNIANGNAAHAEGQSTVAAGNYSHAQGYRTRAGVEPRPCTLISSKKSNKNQTVVIVGVFEEEYKENDTIILSFKYAQELFSVKRKIKNLNFNLENNQTTFSISPPLKSQVTDVKVYSQSMGKYAHAQGVGTSALGEFSTAIGKNITVTGEGSVGIQLNNETNQVLSQDNTFVIVGGKVGIGTLSPMFDLDVDGDLKVGDLHLSGNKISNFDCESKIVLESKSLDLCSNTISFGKFAKTRIINQQAQAGSVFSQNGDAQESKYFLIKETTDANFVSLTCNGQTESCENLISIPKKCTWMFNITISAYNVTNNSKAAINLRGALGNNNSSWDFIGDTVSELFLDEEMESVDVQIECNTGFFKIKVKGIIDETIKWHAVLKTNEVYHI